MFVGEGGVGKTSLCNCLMGKSFVKTESTVGLTQLTCEIQRAVAASNGGWVEHKKPEREYEAGVAQLVLERQNDNNQNGGEGDSHSTFLPPDRNLLNRYLGDVSIARSDLILSLFDFGGQSVFNIIHHLFLTAYGVYVVVFRMADILDEVKVEKSFTELSFWINSIAIHSRDAKTGNIAPVFLVGTHKDKISDPDQHRQISKKLEQRLLYNIVWPRIIECEELCFFPVDNTMGLKDLVIMNLMIKIEIAAKEADYVKEPKPLTWLKALDELVAHSKTFLTHVDASSIAISNGVEESDVDRFLSFLNEMGVVLWHNQPGLRDVIILDIFTFFVEPVTLVICNHLANRSDCTVHHREIQEYCKKYHFVLWDEMTRKGVVGRDLLNILLRNKVEESNIVIVINLMLKYGLIVELEQDTEEENSNERNGPKGPEKYVVPALFPDLDDINTYQHSIWKNVRDYQRCYFVFTANCIDSASYSVLDLKEKGFLPGGLMERLLGKVVNWSQLTRVADKVQQLYKKLCILQYGSQWFRIVSLPELNCIRLDIEGMHPLPVHNRVREQIRKCIGECMGSLQFTTALPIGIASESEEGFVLVKVDAVKYVLLTGNPIILDGYPPLDRQYIIDDTRLRSWLENDDVLDAYDVFISHRWNKEDDKVVDLLCDALLNRAVGRDKRAIQVFLDKVRLKEGLQFQNALGRALINSTILIPVFSAAALNRLLTHNPSEVDNLLIEWILALECMEDPIHSKLRKICPLIFGERSPDGSIGDMFAEGIIAQLPEVVPAKSIETVASILKENHIDESPHLHHRTVQSVVSEMSKFLGIRGWEQPLKSSIRMVAKNVDEGNSVLIL